MGTFFWVVVGVLVLALFVLWCLLCSASWADDRFDEMERSRERDQMRRERFRAWLSTSIKRTDNDRE